MPAVYVPLSYISPRRAWDPPRYIVKKYLDQVLVATCQNCRIRPPHVVGEKHQAPSRLKYIRIQFPRGLKLCPACQNALFWERVDRDAVNPSPANFALPQLRDKVTLDQLS